MPKAVWQAPSHRRENAKGFRNVRQHDYKEANCGNQQKNSSDCQNLPPSMCVEGTLMSVIFD